MLKKTLVVLIFLLLAGVVILSFVKTPAPTTEVTKEIEIQQSTDQINQTPATPSS